MAQDYSIYINYDNRHRTVKLFTDLDSTEQAFRKLADTIQWRVYCTAVEYCKQADALEDSVNSNNWPPIKLRKTPK